MQAQGGKDVVDGAARHREPQGKIVVALRGRQADDQPARIPETSSEPVTCAHRSGLAQIHAGQTIVRYDQIIEQTKDEELALRGVVFAPMQIEAVM